MYREKRIDKRVKKQIFFKVLSDNSKEQSSIDISLGGLLMESDKHYNINQLLQLELIIPNNKSILCDSRVAWVYSATRGEPFHRVGLQFMEMTSRDQEKLKNSIYWTNEV